MLFAPSSSAAAPFDIRPPRTKKKIESSSRKPFPPEILSLELLPLKTHHRDVSNLSISCSVNPSGGFPDEVDPSALGSKLRSCFTEKDVRRLHSIVYKRPENSNTYVMNNLISAYARLGKLIEARKAFDRMSLKNVVSWTCIITAYLRFGLDIEALSVFRDFVASGIQANCKTFVGALNLCSRRLDYELGQQIHASIIKSRGNNLVVDSAIVYFYAQCCDLSSASCAFDRMPAYDVISWTTMITAYSQQGLGKKAFSLFTRMLSEGYVANEFTVCSVLNACGQEMTIGLGRQLHGTIVKKTVKDDVFVGTSLVDMYAKCGDIVDCRKVFDGMSNRNTVTWTAIIAGYARNGYGEEALYLFRIMRRRNLFVNNLTMVSILKACGSVRALMLGKEVHARLLKKFGEFDIYIGSSLVWMYCKCEKSCIASNVLQQMPLKDVVLWTSMISGCSSQLGHESEALEFLKEMLGEGVEPNPFTYSSALKACARLEDIEQGKLIHCSAKKTAAITNVYVGSALISMYTKCGYISDAVQVFDGMAKRNLVAWKTMVVGYARNGLCEEALKLLYRMKEEGVEVDDYVHTEVLTACGDYDPTASQVLLENNIGC